VAKSGSSISAVANRYAGSLYELAAGAGVAADVERDLGNFQSLLDSNPDLVRLIRSPVFSAEEQSKAISAILARVGISGLTANFLRVVARNRRLFAVPAMISAFRRIAAEARGETSADVTSAHALTAEQETELKVALKNVAGKDVALAVKVDPSLLGGLVVKMGSRQIDTSLKTKLASLKLALKEVG
jgi:F-type H+-transporting ATPase subunit delta